MKIINIAKTSSSNTGLRKWSDAHPDVSKVVYCVEEQSKGRGQRGNSWEAKAGENITMSLLLKPSFVKADEQFIISQVVSLAIVDFLSQHVEGISIKWPNDIYYGDKKICGILIENDISEDVIARSIIGIGLNINQKEFTSDAPNPISLTQITGKEYDLQEVVYAISSGIFTYCNFLKTADKVWSVFRTKYADKLYRKNDFYSFEDENGHFRAKIHHVEPSGILVLEKEADQKLVAFSFKEVRFMI